MKTDFKSNEMQLILLVCDRMRVSYEVLISKRRKHEIVETRQVVSYVLLEHTKLTYQGISDLVNYKSHASPIRDHKEVLKFLSFDKDYINRILPVLKEAADLAQKLTAYLFIPEPDEEIFDFYSEAAFLFESLIPAA